MNISPAMTIGIVGGVGKTGAQFARLFRAQGFTVRVTGKADKQKNVALIRDCDVVVFAVPLEHAAEVIAKEVKAAVRNDQLILDVSSLKADTVRAMLGAKGEVIGMHPLFSPTTALKGQTVILCPARCKPGTLTSLKRVLTNAGLKSIEMTPKAHDDQMAVIQAIPHFKSLLMGELLQSLSVDLHAVSKTCTPTYELEFNVIGRFLDDEPELYMPIIFRNPAAPAILRRLKRLLDGYIRIADRRDLPAASRRYRRLKSHFAPFAKRARSHSEACIATLSKLSR